jgi:hypothetical protein
MVHGVTGGVKPRPGRHQHGPAAAAGDHGRSGTGVKKFLRLILRIVQARDDGGLIIIGQKDVGEGEKFFQL